MLNHFTGLKYGFQKTDTSPALVINAVTDSYFEHKTECVVAVDSISGNNNTFVLDHINSDIDNTTSQNGVNIRGEIVAATVKEVVEIGDTTIKIDITCHIHKGMRFEYGGEIFKFTSHGYYDPTRPENNTDVIINIEPAPIQIPQDAEIEQFYCVDNIKIQGNIRGMNKGIRIIATDARLCTGIEIDCDFENNVVSDIEVPLGIEIKYKDTYMFNNSGSTMTIVDGIPTQTTVVRYNIVGKNKIGYSTQIPTKGSWNVGDFLYYDSVTDPTLLGWRCIVAGEGEDATWTTITF